MGIINDALNSATKQAREAIDDFESYIVHTSKWAEDRAETIERGVREFDRQLNFDEREPIEGEAKALSPLHFLQFTPIKLVGVTRLPLGAAKGIGWVVANRKVIMRGINTVDSWIAKPKPQLSGLKTNMKGQLENLRGKVPQKVKNAVKEMSPKNPRTKGMMTGASAAIVMDIVKQIGQGTVTTGTSTRSSGDDDRNNRNHFMGSGGNDMFISTRKVSRSRWV